MPARSHPSLTVAAPDATVESPHAYTVPLEVTTAKHASREWQALDGSRWRTQTLDPKQYSKPHPQCHSPTC